MMLSLAFSISVFHSNLFPVWFKGQFVMIFKVHSENVDCNVNWLGQHTVLNLIVFVLSIAPPFCFLLASQTLLSTIKHVPWLVFPLAQAVFVSPLSWHVFFFFLLLAWSSRQPGCCGTHKTRSNSQTSLGILSATNINTVKFLNIRTSNKLL